MELTNYQKIQAQNRIKLATSQILWLRQHIENGGMPNTPMTTQICHILISAALEVPWLRESYVDCGLSKDDLFHVILTPWRLEIKGELETGFISIPQAVPIGCELIMRPKRIARIGQILPQIKATQLDDKSFDMAQGLNYLQETNPVRASMLTDAISQLAHEIIADLEPQFGKAIVSRNPGQGMSTPTPRNNSGCIGMMALVLLFASCLVLGLVYINSASEKAQRVWPSTSDEMVSGRNWLTNLPN